MKHRTFFWGWQHYDPRPDPMMSAERAVRLFRAWRRARTQGRREFGVKKLGAHRYQITHQSGESAVICWSC